MTYETSETSVHDAKPVELFKFDGTYANFYYTSGPQPVVFDGNTYAPIAIKRTEVKAGTQEDDGLDITVEVSALTELAQTYGFSETPPKLYLTIYRFHRDGPTDWRTYWAGPITQIQTNDGRSTLRSPSALSFALAGSIPNVYFQSPCNHILFDRRCKILESDWTFATTVTAVAGKEITVASVDFLDGKLIGGELGLASGERRMIVDQAGDVVTVNFPFYSLLVGTSVSLVAGCDHAYLGDCSASKFNNQKRYGGQPFIPNDNVFQTGLEPGTTLPDGTCLPYIPVFEGYDYEVFWDVVFSVGIVDGTIRAFHTPEGEVGQVVGHTDTTLTRRFYRRITADAFGGYVGDGTGDWGSTLDLDVVDPFGPDPLDGNVATRRCYFRHWTEATGAEVYGPTSGGGGTTTASWISAITWADKRP